MQALIFTDLDGTLLDHESYSLEPAREALDWLAAQNCSPIFNSSKTRAEITRLQQQLKLDCAFICENGAVLHNYAEPGTTPQEVSFGNPASTWIDRVHKLRQQKALKFTGFSDWTIGEVAELTGLNNDEAELAKQREYSEPVLWQDSESALDSFRSELGLLNLTLLEGGRFYSIQGNFDKSTAMQWLKQRDCNAGKTVIALGDSPNDTAMLEAADIAVIIKSSKSSRIELEKPAQVIHSTKPGPEGWHSAMCEIIAQLDAGAHFPDQENNHG